MKTIKKYWKYFLTICKHKKELHGKGLFMTYQNLVEMNLFLPQNIIAEISHPIMEMRKKMDIHWHGYIIRDVINIIGNSGLILTKMMVRSKSIRFLTSILWKWFAIGLVQEKSITKISGHSSHLLNTITRCVAVGISTLKRKN